MKKFRSILASVLALCMIFSVLPTAVFGAEGNTQPVRSVHSNIVIDDDATGGYEGDYVVIYNPATSSSTSYSTGTMTGLIETTVNSNVIERKKIEEDRPSCIIDVDGIINERNRAEDPSYGKIAEGNPTRATSYNVGDTRSFSILSYNPGSGSSLTFKVLAKGDHCYIWTPSQNVTNYYTLDSIDPSYAQQAADEFDRMYDLMNTSFGNHSNGSNGDGRVSLLFYNIDDGWNGSGGFVAGYFSSASYTYDSMPIINIDTYPGVYYKTSSGNEGKSMDIAYSTACHEYQHCINYSNTSSMSTWLNECFSAAAEEICYPGSSVVSRIQSWENYFYSDNDDWQNPPAEFAYNSAYTLHTGFSMYNWNNNLEMDDTLCLYAQVSFFAQYLYTRFGNGIYKQISNKFSSSEPTAITNATGVNCADLVRDFRVAVTANATQSQYNGIYGFKAQEAYDPASYHDVQNPYDLLGPVVFTGSSCSIKGGGAITVKPVNGVYNPPSGASSSLKYIGIKLAPSFTLTAVSNNENWGTVDVNNDKILCTPANGYYVESCTVLSGTAACTINGNTITVAADSDCTVQVNFAPKPTYTVNFVASGNAEGSQTALVQDVITLPATVSATAQGWTFIGWMDHQIDETTDKPTYYAPGASYTVTGNATLYAVYTRVEEGTGEVIYQKVSSLEDDAEYILVDSNSISGSSGYAVGNAIVTSNHYLNAVSVTVNSDDTVTATAANLPKIIWKADAASNGYTFYNENVGKYMGLDSSEYLYPSATALAWAYTAEGYLDNQSDSEGYYYLSLDTTNIRYTTNKAGKVINFYKAINDSTTYYWTDPIAAEHEHTPAEPVIENEIAATCTAAGSYDSVVYCAECGEELSRETVAVPALGHDYVAVVTEPTCTEAGYTTYTCSRCGDSYTEEIAALGHLPGEPVQENYVEPTVGVEGGYDMVVYCQRCGEELSREHTVLPGLPNPEPIETSNLRIYSSISVGTDMVVTWSARKSDVANYEKFWIEVVKHAPDGDETYLYGDEQEEALDESTSTWQVNFKHIFAKEMGVEIEARVYAEDANGQIYMSPAKSTNIRDYLGGRLTLTNNTVEQRVLAADMLNYGAAAQLFGNYNTEHLVNEELTAEQLAKLDEYETKELPVVEKTNSNYRPEGQSNILFNSVSLDNEVLLTLTVRAAEGSDVKVLMKDHESGTIVETLDTEWVGSNYVVNYSGIGADKMRMAYDFVAQIDGAETGNVRTWSVEGYVGELRSGNNQLQINVANALLAYGDAAAAYFAAQ